MRRQRAARGASVRAARRWRSATAAAKVCALEEKETERRRFEGEGGELTSSPLFNSEGRSCALDLLRTISVTDEELPRDPPHDRPHDRPQEANRSVWRI